MLLLGEEHSGSCLIVIAKINFVFSTTTFIPLPFGAAGVSQLVSLVNHHSSSEIECDETRRLSAKPRVVIVGAGMAGLSAARRLRSIKNADYELIVLEGSHRIGGRICTSEFGGERVELGTTWIHDIEGSPLYEIAKQSGALKGDMPWECMDGFPACPIVKAEGGFVVDQAVVEPVVQFYKELICEAQNQQEIQLKESRTMFIQLQDDNDRLIISLCHRVV
ncbi:hypothetical protein O6H91_06G093700 [Diphasiastrum complanatum]|uniref:Uncharacterized protein n=1 Tax=Diphasiastrum complanatum TaxID=34168 RepID=A0ACC2DGC0_DIPCM|nr:hypothetical protein O6H91_06G093700 [Diphasiastrum complanatum]